MIKAGFSEVDITPHIGMAIPGQFYKRVATGIKDPLFAKGFVLQNDKKTLTMVAIDALFIDYDVVMRIRHKASVLTGIQENHIMVSAIHTHTGGPVANFSENNKDEKYLDFLVEKAVDAIIIAYGRVEPVRLGFGIGSEKDISHIRRFFMKDGTYTTNPRRADPNIDRPDGVIDPDVVVIRVDDMNGNPAGVITNFACHLDCVGGTEYSADYAGELSRSIKNTLGQGVVSLFLTGACGNINHVNFSSEISVAHDHYKEMGRIVAYEALKIREKIELLNEVDLDVNDMCFDAKVRVPTQKDVLDAERIIANADGNKSLDFYYANEIVKLFKMNITSVKFPVQVFKIGQLAITALPGEVFDEFAFEIKAKSPFTYNIINTLANGNTGYIPIREAYARGGYEPRLNTYSKLVPEVGEEMLSEALRLIDELKVG